MPTLGTTGQIAGIPVMNKTSTWTADTESTTDTTINGSWRIYGIQYDIENSSAGATAWALRLAMMDGTDEYNVIADDDTNFADPPTSVTEKGVKYMTSKFPNGILLNGDTVRFGATPGTDVTGTVRAVISLVGVPA